jgi:Ca2+/Na+ antiporter
MILPAPQQAPAPPPAAAPQPLGPSYVDLLAGKRREILKVVGSALMILFALALYTGIEFWLKEVVVKHDWSFKQELGARLAYPFVVLLVLWNFKVLA